MWMGYVLTYDSVACVGMFREEDGTMALEMVKRRERWTKKAQRIDRPGACVGVIRLGQRLPIPRSVYMRDANAHARKHQAHRAIVTSALRSY